MLRCFYIEDMKNLLECNVKVNKKKLIRNLTFMPCMFIGKRKVYLLIQCVHELVTLQDSFQTVCLLGDKNSEVVLSKNKLWLSNKALEISRMDRLDFTFGEWR